MSLYDTIGHGYRRLRQQDPRIANRIFAALGRAASVVNVGAGTGSYEPRDRKLVAVDPSQVMLRQRALDAAPAVQASATDLPFRDESFDAALAVLTIHHWPDLARGLQELRRASRRRTVILTFDPAFTGFWQDRLMTFLTLIHEVESNSGGQIFTVSYRFSESFSATVGLSTFYGEPSRARVLDRSPVTRFHCCDYTGRTSYQGVSPIAERDELFFVIRKTF